MINIRIERASNGVILRGNIGENGKHQSELFIFKEGWETALTQRLDEIEIDAKDQVTQKISDILTQATTIEE